MFPKSQKCLLDKHDSILNLFLDKFNLQRNLSPEKLFSKIELSLNNLLNSIENLKTQIDSSKK